MGKDNNKRNQIISLNELRHHYKTKKQINRGKKKTDVERG